MLMDINYSNPNSVLVKEFYVKYHDMYKRKFIETCEKKNTKIWYEIYK